MKKRHRTPRSALQKPRKVVPYEEFLEKQREKRYGTRGQRFGGLPRLTQEQITAISTPEVDNYGFDNPEN